MLEEDHMNEISGVLVNLKPFDDKNCIMVFECDQLLVADANVELKVPIVFAAKVLDLDNADIEKYNRKLKDGLQFKETHEFIKNNPYQELIQLVKREIKIFPQA